MRTSVLKWGCHNKDFNSFLLCILNKERFNVLLDFRFLCLKCMATKKTIPYCDSPIFSTATSEKSKRVFSVIYGCEKYVLFATITSIGIYQLKGEHKMKISELQDEIIRMKKEQDVCILAHAYQSHDIWEVADYIGDSYGLAKEAMNAPQKIVIMCGVRFMAETVKLLSPDKRVMLPKPAGCPMAEQFTVEDVEGLKRENPGYSVVAYINTTAALKTVCDVCVTSASAVNIVKNMNTDKIIFIPDIHLGSWVKAQFPNKDIKLFNGGCPAHGLVTGKEALSAKKEHPDALLLVHPECSSEVTSLADYVGSTTGIMSYVENSDAGEFIIGTENSIVSHLQLAHPNKRFYELSKRLICEDMKLTTLGDVYGCLKGMSGEEIILDEETMKNARHCIDEMLRLG